MRFPNRMWTSLATLGGSVLLCGTTALAQQTPAPGTIPQANTPPGSQQQTQSGMSRTNENPNLNNGAGQTSPGDRVFVGDALKGGMAEVQLGQLALQKSTNADIKQFAQKMVDDHTKMDDQMKTIAQQIGVKVPDGPSKKDKATIAKLQALNGDDFDKAYVKEMVEDHKTDLNDFKAEAENGSDATVRNAANQGSQIINQHLQMIEQIAQKDNLTASK